MDGGRLPGPGNLAAGLPAKYPEDTPDTWILLLFLGRGDPEWAPSLHRKHPNVSGLWDSNSSRLSSLFCMTPPNPVRTLSLTQIVPPTSKALICQGLGYKPGVNLPSSRQVPSDGSVSRPFTDTVPSVSKDMCTSDL